MERYVKIFKKIDDIKDMWDSLYSGGEDMTPYQSFDWNKNVADCYKSNTYIFLNFTVRYFVCFKDTQPLIIAPLALPKSNHNDYCYTQILGQYTKSGALNFIYGNEAADEDFRFLIEYVQNVYQCEIRFNNIADYTKFNAFLSLCDEAEKISENNCVRCKIPLSKEDFASCLEEETILDIEEYIKKDKQDIKVEIQYGYSFRTAEAEAIKELLKKSGNKKHIRKPKTVDNGLKFINNIREKIFKNKDAITNFSENENFFFVSCSIKNVLAGVFFGVSDINENCIVHIMATDPKFSNYCPEMIMIYEFILGEIEKENTGFFDLSCAKCKNALSLLPNPMEYSNNSYKIEADRSFIADIIEKEIK